MNDIKSKTAALRRGLRSLGPAVLAFSGGVDSSLLLRLAHEELGEKLLAVTVNSCLFPRSELTAAVELCATEGVRHIVVDFDPFAVAGFADNPPDRCYFCKRALLELVIRAAGEMTIIDGTNKDDEGDYRPGMKALDELGVRSPLREAGFTKDDIRALSRELGLPTWDMPSRACLATRIPCGQQVTAEALARTEAAERFLLDSGFTQVRVRHLGSGTTVCASIEVESAEMDALLHAPLREEIVERFLELGYADVVVDPRGYRCGSLNP